MPCLSEVTHEGSEASECSLRIIGIDALEPPLRKNLMSRGDRATSHPVRDDDGIDSMDATHPLRKSRCPYHKWDLSSWLIRVLSDYIRCHVFC